MMEIFTDANFSVGNYRGMGRYLNHFLSTIENEYPSIHIKRLLRSGVIGEGCWSFGSKNYIFWEQISFASFIRKNNPEVILFPYNTAPYILGKSGKKILILHDLIFLNSFRETGFSISPKQNIGKIYRRLVVPHAIRQADVIVTVSNYTRAEILKRYTGIRKKFYVIPNSIDVPPFENTSANLSSNSDSDKFILHVGGEAPQKNSKAVILAYSKLNGSLKSRYHLKILGIRSAKMIRYLHSLSDELGVLSRVKILPFVEERELMSLYRKASLFLFPSFYEGFGIPLIEAMASGCPIVSSNTSCLPEIVGEAGMYFDPADIEAQAAAIENVLNSNDLRHLLIERGHEQVKRFSTKEVDKLIFEFVQNELLV